MSNVCVPMEPVEPKREILRCRRKVEEECEKPEHGIVKMRAGMVRKGQVPSCYRETRRGRQSAGGSPRCWLERRTQKVEIQRVSVTHTQVDVLVLYGRCV